MNALIEQFFNLGVMAKAFPLLWRGFGMTLLLCLTVIPLGFLGGLLVALARLSRLATLRLIVRVLTDLFRALPPLVLLILVYSGLPFAGVRLNPFTSVCIAFFLNTSAYYGEVMRAGIESIGTGQWEAARSTGLSARDTFAFVILPQALRNVLPDLVSNTVEVVKLTSIASVVSMTELLYSADMARSLTFNASPVVEAGLFYLVLLWPFVRLASRLEHRVGT
jgi:polar amino acid transport system permease protein